MTQPTSKADFRTHFASIRAKIFPDDRRAADRALCQSLIDLPAFRDAAMIGGYAPIRGEIDLTPVWQAAVAAGKPYALPCTVTGATEGRMIFRAMTDFAPDALIAGRFGIPEPPDTAPILRPSDWEGGLLILPALGFDDSGFRVGYGGGYYDRYVADLVAAGVTLTTVGLVYAACRVPQLPREAHDRPADLILDERRITVPHER